ncbi:SpaA isopeptide-forming pilin-related protein [Streptococcus intermedius]|uniref:Putative fimbrial structural subunit n=2 Tax=Streptococcus TaxID=1301 RepID=T1ZEI8_STRIT|nr:SpaA isopeptide-forming pilin-related protein [Streptococcus intermedius]AGU75867.1 putative fimbrial structural subunit [Streptococcus intermedius B196]MDP1433635.1 SpaA isopeptide-forming pilin-related protein [Streptococcus intermedius]
MNLLKKLVAFIATMFAVGVFGTLNVSATSNTDTATLKITNIEGNPTVKLYKIGTGEYNANNDSFIKFKYENGVSLTETGPTSQEITKIANDINKGTISLTPVDVKNNVSDTYTYQATGAGVYIAILTGATDGRTYNPVLLAASYNGEGILKGGEASSKANYLYGQTTVAKSTLPSIKKEVSNTTKDGDKDTASVGQELTYKLTVQLPSYAKEAVNKTVYISDTMSAGLMFDYSSLAVKWNGKTATISSDGSVMVDGMKIATARHVGNGFNLSFVYDALNYISPEVSYKAVVNEKAVVGNTGNTNNAELFYSNHPTNGSTYENLDKKPEQGNGITKKEDKKIVYTYQVAFKKIDSKTKNPLANAIFGIYDSSNKLVDTVTTNNAGYAVSTQVSAGTYTIKELKAPKGYSLNTNTYTVTASQTTATITTNVASTKTEYTTDVNQAGNDKSPVGWLKNNIFYLKKPSDDAKPAYIKSTSTTTATAQTMKTTGTAGTAVLTTDIPNTKLGELPSTGGIGTLLFTMIGVVVMAAAAGIYVLKHKKS